MSLSLEINNINCLQSQDNEPVEIINGLYLGSCFASYNVEALKQRNIKYIVNCSSGDYVYGHDFVYMHVHVKDKEEYNFLSSLYYSVDFIAEGLRKGSVFVFCTRGRCRSVSTIAGYLMAYCQMSFDEALQLIYSKRPQLKINDSFLLQLQLFYECGCSIHLSSQLFMLYELTSLHDRFMKKGQSRKSIQFYKSTVPSTVDICYPDQKICHLPLPHSIGKSYYCKYCHTRLCAQYNILDHRNINFTDLSNALLAILDHKPSLTSIHCVSSYIHDTFFRRLPFDQEMDSSLLSCASDIELDDWNQDLTKLNISVVPDTSSTIKELSSIDEIQLSPSTPSVEELSPCQSPLIEIQTSFPSVQTTLCQEQDSIQLPHKCHSYFCTDSDVFDSSNLSDSSQESMSAPESSDLPISKNTRQLQLDNPQRIDHEENKNSLFSLDDYSTNIELNEINKRSNKKIVKHSIFDEVEDDDDLLDSILENRQRKNSQSFLSLQYPSSTIQDQLIEQIKVFEEQHPSPSPPLFTPSPFILNDSSFDKRICLIPQEVSNYCNSGKDNSIQCDCYFVEPLDWMIQQLMEHDSDIGELRCCNPKCNHVIGGFDLHSDHACSCGFSPFTYFFIYKDCAI